MLPVALTCPLWWVARWASRLLAGLALTAGLTLGVAGPASAGESAVTGAAAVAAPAGAGWSLAADVTCTGVELLAAAPADGPSTCGWAVVAPAGGLPQGTAGPAPVTAADAVARSQRSATASGPRAPPLG